MGGSSTHYEVRYIQVESEESKRIREKNALEEKNRAAASKELPKFFGIVQTDFSTKLKGKISKMKKKIEKE